MSKYLEEMIKKGASFTDVVPLEFKKYQDLVEELKLQPQVKSVNTPYQNLQALNDGFDPGRLYVIGAPPKMGKTTFVTSMMYQLSKQKTKTLLFSYEVSWQEITKTIMRMEEQDNVPIGSIDLPLFVPMELHRGGDKLQLQWLLEAVAKAKEEGMEMVFIDHLHYLIPYQMTDNFSIVVGNVVREIKRIAVLFQIPIVLIVPMKNLQTARKPTFWDIRDSSMILHEADDVMIMYRLKIKQALKMGVLTKEKEKGTRMSDDEEDDDDVYCPVSVLSLELSRKRGASGKIYLWHNGAYFIEVAKSLVPVQVDKWKQENQNQINSMLEDMKF